jgi:tellurite methyltransferase
VKLQHSPLIEKYLPSLLALQANNQAPVLDLACGSGRNGLYLVENDIYVNFADVNGESLEQVKKSLSCEDNTKQSLAQYWQVDFEQANTTPLQGKHFAACMVFRYLHRPLFEQIKAAIMPGGMIIYETFTEQQAQFGRPTNPNFLLKAAELLELFSDWKVLHSFEGLINKSDDTKVTQAIAQIVAIKPS